MLIERILSEPAGTKVPFPGITYHFKPRVEGGPHVAEVEDPMHIERLLAIREGYRAAEPIAPSLDLVLDGAAEANAARLAALQAEREHDDASGASADIPLEELSEDALREIYAAEIGRPAHPRAGRASIIEKIEAARAAA